MTTSRSEPVAMKTIFILLAGFIAGLVAHSLWTAFDVEAQGADEAVSFWAFLQGNAFFLTELIQIGILLAILSQVGVMSRESADTHAREKKKATLDFILSIWSVYERPRRMLDLKFQDHETVPEAQMCLKDRMRAATLFNCMNAVSVGLRQDALSSEIIGDLYASHFIGMGQKYREFLNERAGYFDHYEAVRQQFENKAAR